jgi:hypothetical protein
MRQLLKMLPKLERNGFAVRILATRGTIDLCSYMLPDAGCIQESEVAALNRRNASRGRAEVTPIYTQADAVSAMQSFAPVIKDMLDLARHIVNQKSGSFEPEKLEDHYEAALIDLINQKRAGKPIRRGENVVDLMEALRRSVGGRAADAKAKSPEKAAKKPRKGAAGQKEMLMPIEGKKQAKAAPAKKAAARPQRRSA